LVSKKYSGKPPRVEIDQDVSPYYTVIDIYADDRIGLLYDLAQVMRRLNLYVEVSKISTKVDQVSDAFYVQDIFGHKINERGKARSIKQSLQEALEKPVHE
jgi:[protein-PII] uridylyltransferase